MIYAGSATTNALLSNLIEPPAYIAMPEHTRHETFCVALKNPILAFITLFR